MISKLGNFLQITSIALNLMAIIMPGKVSKNIFYLSCLSIVSSFALLLYAFIISDFTVQNVFFNSSTIKPLIYKIAGAWASHEGSILLWLSLLSLINLSFILNLPNNFQYFKVIINILSLIQILFVSYIFFTSNPFIAISFKPLEGLGLNPVLQDLALAIHPPILYLGYVSYIIPFTCACLFLLKHNINEKEGLELFKYIQIYSNIGILALTLGVGLGAWWAYRELGWGGYWFFDPVENISLMPWLTGIALYHTIIITVKHQRLINWTLSLSIISYLLTLLGTFLVRSGLLTSVHAFAASSQRAIYLLIIFSLIALPSLFLLSIRNEILISPKNILFKEKGIIIGNIFWLMALLTLIVATFYPLIYSVIYEQSISVNVEYYTKFFIPILIPTLILAGVFSTKAKYKTYLINISLSLIITLFCYHKIKGNISSYIAIFCATFLLFQTLYILLVRSNYFRQKIAPPAAAMITAHSGFAILALAIVFNSLLQEEIEFIGKIGDKKNYLSFNIHLKNIKFSEGQNYYRQIAEFWIDDKNNNIIILKPENRLYKIEKSLSQESDIYSYLFYDLYAVLNKVDDEIIHAKIYYRPFISFIWMAIMLIVGGFLIRIHKK